MCGIFCSLSRHGYVVPDTNTKQLLQNRGPDSTGQHQTLIHATGRLEQSGASQVHATFLSTVLSLRGRTIVDQPLKDKATGSVLCWNGEAWTINNDVVTGNDSELVFTELLKACTGSAASSTPGVISLLSSVRGPYAFVFFDAGSKHLYYARDCLGRRSLLTKSTSENTLVLSSVCDNSTGEAWTEVEADGIYIVDLNVTPFTHTHIPHRRSDQDGPKLSFVGKSSAVRVSLTAIDPAISRHELLDPCTGHAATLTGCESFDRIA